MSSEHKPGTPGYAQAYPERVHNAFYVVPGPWAPQPLHGMRPRVPDEVRTPQVIAAIAALNDAIAAAHADLQRKYELKLAEHEIRVTAAKRQRAADEADWLRVVFGITDLECPLFKAIYTRAHKVSETTHQPVLSLLASMLSSLYTPEIRAICVKQEHKKDGD